MIPTQMEKELAAASGLDFVEDGMTLGLGTGSTAAIFVRLLGERVRAGLKVSAIPTSRRTEQLALEAGIPLTNFSEVERLDLTVDGTDEFDPHLNLIKGGGGALLREKIVATASDRLVIICDSKKQVEVLGRFPVPVEVIPFGWQTVARGLARLGCQTRLRLADDGETYRTVQGNLILDCSFGLIAEPAELDRQLRQIVGVVEHGLFVGIASVVALGRKDQVDLIYGANGGRLDPGEAR